MVSEMSNKAINAFEEICNLSQEGQVPKQKFYDLIHLMRNDEDSQKFNEVIEVFENKLELDDKEFEVWSNLNWLYFQFLLSTI